MRVVAGLLDETVVELEGIVRDCIVANDRCGYFAAMYLTVTRTVSDRCERGQFEDPERMAHFVATFAQRYIDAHRTWRAGGTPMDAWVLAFDTSRRSRPLILQHLLLGMNAHINLDLGVTAADIARASGNLAPMRGDFEAINEVLASMVDRCENAVGSVSPWLRLGDRLASKFDEHMMSAALIAARTQAWRLAEHLVTLEGEALATAIISADRTTATVGNTMLDPGRWPRFVGWIVRLRERAQPSDVIRLLASVSPA